MKRSLINRAILGQALRIYRERQSLTKAAVERRRERLDGAESRLSGNQLTNLEAGRGYPNLETLLDFLAAASEDGEHVDFCAWQHALEEAAGLREPPLLIDHLLDEQGPTDPEAQAKLEQIFAGPLAELRESRSETDKLREQVDELQRQMALLMKKERNRGH